MFRSLKYGTGHEVPRGAIYLSTQVEKEYAAIGEGAFWKFGGVEERNVRVWHYFLVDCDEDGNPPPTRENPSPLHDSHF